MSKDITVSEVATCLCGCGEIPDKGREYVWGHKGKRHEATNGASRKVAPRIDFKAILNQLEDERDRIEEAIKAILPLTLR